MSNDQIAFTGSILNVPACMLGEGPTYDQHTGTAWWFDIVGRMLVEYALKDSTCQIHDLPVMGSVLARVDDEQQVIATETGLHLRQTATGKLELITPIEADNDVTRSNDGRVHACGALWIGTMGKKAEKQAGAIYHVARGVVTTIFPDITIPNAICFSPDGTIAYFADTDTDRMMRVEIDPATALPLGEPAVFIDHRGEGGLDGAVCDADGTIWNARWGAGCVDGYSPQGKRLISLQVPASQTSCPAFVGEDASQLLVTSARESLSDEELAVDPNAGLTFLLDHKVKGRFEPDYIL
ncbi:MAG: SMP-30/gluconolactonase/LRE family protein [Hoeflea sp.]|uniref:SMP-30/gluconolactonase/LRE family protein n=1 Tax=Hoeflea sp. TaxID=1940281 RepID=UPI001D8AF7C8|nr:SMP-30/gluconolactonase/LRE family protein [Hoeflea sp.]MBU4529098.1 SMP-30/gluconolactonase/LRE family protein [Alphaproteobacteria bacterium]MBU4543503.1 SMP-30/gluconolactonase/LRE family protein [Alphaproteobacteria bacterium]MBU4549128.1 SMP-30/gluconolactonase/LRE family protein [Alphaproteobacteria bacterium]MBV1725263.1 SMP-30/gluconolactonase/LRE family protein [Hoeflea sp.]MBV1785224.1 SMP-30/gluconolactonase/LRE family protein [Hoeflea sp.]